MCEKVIIICFKLLCTIHHLLNVLLREPALVVGDGDLVVGDGDLVGAFVAGRHTPFMSSLVTKRDFKR